MLALFLGSSPGVNLYIKSMDTTQLKKVPFICTSHPVVSTNLHLSFCDGDECSAGKWENEPFSQGAFIGTDIFISSIICKILFSLTKLKSKPCQADTFHIIYI